MKKYENEPDFQKTIKYDQTHHNELSNRTSH